MRNTSADSTQPSKAVFNQQISENCCTVQAEAKAYPFYLANEPVYANEELLVTDKYTNKVAYKVAVASPQDIDR